MFPALQFLDFEFLVLPANKNMIFLKIVAELQIHKNLFYFLPILLLEQMNNMHDLILKPKYQLNVFLTF